MIDVDEAIFWSLCLRWTYKNQNSFVENIHSFPNLYYPFVIIKVAFWQWIFVSPVCKNIEQYVWTWNINQLN